MDKPAKYSTPSSKHMKKEEENFMKLSYLLFRMSHKAASRVFFREFAPDKLKKELQRNITTLQSLKNKRVISNSQWSTMFPTCGNPFRPENFDITLMTVLLRHLTDMDIDDKLPTTVDFDEAAAISTIKFLRNELVHQHNGWIQNEMFYSHFDMILKAVKKLDPDVGQECESLRMLSLQYSKPFALSKDVTFSPLHQICYEGNKDLAMSLIEKGIDVNLKNNNGSTPLHFACHEGHLELVKLLLDNNSETNVENVDGSTPLHLASHEGHKEIVELLIRHGADVHKGNNNGSRPLHLAAHEGHRDIVDLLLRNNAFVDQENINKSTPLHLACHENHQNIVELLISKNANVNKGNKNGSTPLHLACFNEHSNIVICLLEHGANVNSKKSDGRTPLHVASKSGKKREVEILLKYNADVGIKDNGGKTALFYAKTCGNSDIVPLLE